MEREENAITDLGKLLSPRKLLSPHMIGLTVISKEGCEETLNDMILIPIICGDSNFPKSSIAFSSRFINDTFIFFRSRFIFTREIGLMEGIMVVEYRL